MGAEIDSLKIPYIHEAIHYANEFFITAAGQRNRNYVGERVEFIKVPFAMEEILFDPQTSGGLLVSLPQKQVVELMEEIEKLGLPCGIVGWVTRRNRNKIIVR